MFKYVCPCPDCGGSLNTAGRCMSCGKVYRGEAPTTAESGTTYHINVTEEQSIKYLKDLGYIITKGGEVK